MEKSMLEPVFGVSEAVAVLNQTLDAVYPTMTIVGELANFKIAKEKWLYGDIKDDTSKLRVFGTVFQLPGPLEDGMMLEIVAEPRIHPQFGFSLNIRSMRPVGEGSIKKAANLLQAKLEKEGLFAEERKRPVPHAPERVGLIASEESAAYADFIKILNERWQGVGVDLHNVQVQGEMAVELILTAVQYFNQVSNPPEVIVVIRGGGSADDLAAFSSEQVTRAVASSRIPTVVAIGHEVDVCLAELAADMRASTPSNAAELLFPDKKEVRKNLQLTHNNLKETVSGQLKSRESDLTHKSATLGHSVELVLQSKQQELHHYSSLLASVHPKSTLKRGYALVQSGKKLVSSTSQVKVGDKLKLTLKDGTIATKAEKVE